MSDPTARDTFEAVGNETSDEDLTAAAPERVQLPPLSTLNVFATYDDGRRAHDALVGLERQGIDSNKISALALDRRDHVEEGSESTQLATVDKDSELLKEVGHDVGRGAVIGALAGALGSTAVALAIPGVGAAIGAGILGVAAGGAMAGTGVGGFAAAVANTPTSSEWEQALVDLTDGRVVVGVHTDDPQLFAVARAVLDDSGALTVRQVGPDGTPLEDAAG